MAVDSATTSPGAQQRTDGAPAPRVSGRYDPAAFTRVLAASLLLLAAGRYLTSTGVL